MIFIVLILAIIIALIFWKKDILQKIKTFSKNYRLLIIIEIIVIIILLVFTMLNNTVTIKEKDPHSNQILKSDNLKEGEIYTYKTMDINKGEDLDDFKSKAPNIKEKDNFIKIEDIGITKVKVLINGVEKEYKYGTGFSYYGIKSCECGTPIIFQKTIVDIIKYMSLSIIIIDLLLVFLIKEK